MSLLVKPRQNKLESFLFGYRFRYFPYGEYELLDLFLGVVDVDGCSDAPGLADDMFCYREGAVMP